MAPNRIQVAMGQGAVARAPHVISSLGLGSCVAVILYDTQRRIGGLAHIMLPDSASVNGRRTPYQCADTAIATLLKRLRSNGAARQDIVAKIVGGARMFSFYEDSNTSIGEQNIRSVRHILRTEQIPLVGEDTGGRHGRSVEFHLDSGRVIVTAIGKEDREV
jgi:chemotaxis protein CheD